jgi:hypothetical protein
MSSMNGSLSPISIRSNIATPGAIPPSARLFEEAKPFLVDGIITELAGNAAAQYHVENSVTEVILEQVSRARKTLTARGRAGSSGAAKLPVSGRLHAAAVSRR